jgi:plastocyanin
MVACSEGAGDGVAMTESQSFDPASFTVSAGASITFSNDSGEAHTVTAYEDDIPDGAEYFSSGDFANEEDARSNLSEGLVSPGDTYELSLDVPGTYRYFCIPHEEQGMVGIIVVEKGP